MLHSLFRIAVVLAIAAIGFVGCAQRSDTVFTRLNDSMYVRTSLLGDDSMSHESFIVQYDHDTQRHGYSVYFSEGKRDSATNYNHGKPDSLQFFYYGGIISRIKSYDKGMNVGVEHFYDKRGKLKRVVFQAPEGGQARDLIYLTPEGKIETVIQPCYVWQSATKGETGEQFATIISIPKVAGYSPGLRFEVIKNGAVIASRQTAFTRQSALSEDWIIQNSYDAPGAYTNRVHVTLKGEGLPDVQGLTEIQILVSRRI